MSKKPASTACLLAVILFLSAINFEYAKAQTSETIAINADGAIAGTSKIQRNGDVYTLTGNISGCIKVQKSNIVIDGAGYTLEGNGEGRGIDLSNGRGQDPSRDRISNVTIKNLRIVNFYYGIDNANAGENIFICNYISECMNSVWIIGSFNNTFVYNTFENASVAINYAGINNITKNNFINCCVTVWLSTAVVDGNYWSDYQERYPDAKEIGNTGVWDTPYEYWEGIIDNHPLTKIVNASLHDSSNAVDTQNSIMPTDEPFPTTLFIVFAIAVAVIVSASLLLLRRKTAQTQKAT